MPLSSLLLLSLSPRERFTAGALTASMLPVLGLTLGLTVLGGGGSGKEGKAWCPRTFIEDDRAGGGLCLMEWWIVGGGGIMGCG